MASVKYCLVLGITLGFTAQVKAQQNTHGSSASAAPAPLAEKKSLIDGLLAAPGTTDRINAGKELEKIINEHYAEAKLSKKPKERAEQIRAKQIFLMTAQYLKAATTCDPKEKVRVYRGLGSSPLLRPKGTNTGGLALFGPLSGQVYRGLNQAKLVETYTDPDTGDDQALRPKTEYKGMDLGQLAYENRNRLGLDEKNVKWNELFGWGREGQDGSPINGRFSDLADSHTANSAGSPLISTSVLGGVADMYAPPVAVLDVCPERLMPAKRKEGEAFQTFGELEMYLPFFVLPEEVVAVEGQGCLLAKMHQESTYPGCKQPTADEAQVSDRTKEFRKIFLNYGFKFERSLMNLAIALSESDSLGGPLNAGYSTKVKKFYEEFDKAKGDLNAWRNRLKLFSSQGNCAVAKELVTKGRQAIAEWKEPNPDDPEELQIIQRQVAALVSKLEEDLAQYRKDLQYRADLKTGCPGI